MYPVPDSQYSTLAQCLKRSRETGRARTHTHIHTMYIFSRLKARSLRTALYIVGLCSDLFGEGHIIALNITLQFI